VQEVDLTRYQHFRAICSLGLPLILGNIAQISIGVVDTVMTGWYSVEALAALVLGSSFFFVVFILGAGFGHALLPLVASAAAREDAVQIRRVTRMGLWLSIIYSAGGIFAFLVFGICFCGAGARSNAGRLGAELSADFKFWVDPGFGGFGAEKLSCGP
jgi:MATE family multidrug resistance protein